MAAAALQPLPRASWFAVHTRSRHEKIVARQFEEKRIEAYLPLREEMRRWQDRWKKVELPLFSGYVFAQYFTPYERISILRTPGVVRIVGFGHQDEPVPVEEIESLLRVLEVDANVHRHCYLRVGQRVRVISGAMAGVEGILARVKKSDRLVININAIQQAVAVEISGYDVLPL